MSDGTSIRGIEDTAHWAAYYRALETRRDDALFRDPHAERLAGQRGAEIARTMRITDRNAWSWSMRTHLFDSFLRDELERGADLVINLAAGLDARPYRLDLPDRLRWVEIDLDAPFDFKESVLAAESPRCQLERVRLDLSERETRRKELEGLCAGAQHAVILSEGFVSYLDELAVSELCEDLLALAPVQSWIVDLMSPQLLKMLAKKGLKKLDDSGTPLRFAPQDGPGFFEKRGWAVARSQSLLHTAAEHKRLPFLMKLFAYVPDTKGREPSKPWGGVCLFRREQ